jgi:protein subunit release factor B
VKLAGGQPVLNTLSAVRLHHQASGIRQNGVPAEAQSGVVAEAKRDQSRKPPRGM